MIRALIFDCDGTLADNEPLHFRALNEALLGDGVTLTGAEYQEVMAPDDAMVRAALTLKGRPADAAKVDALVAAKRQAYLRSLRAGIAPVPGVADFIRAGSKDYLVAIASGAWREEVDAIVDHLGVRDCIRAFVTKEDCPVGKPDPAPFRKALERLNASSPAPDPPLTGRDCLVFEDTPYGITAARSLGIRSVGITTSFTGDRLRDADLVAPNFRALDLRRMTAFFDRRAR